MNQGKTAKTVTDVADALRIAADKAADLLEKLDEANETMRRSSSGILPDGAPVEDMLVELKKTKAREAVLRKLLSSIQYQTQCGSATAYSTIKKIRDIVFNARAI